LDEKAKFHDLGLQSNDIIKVLFKKEASKYKKKSVSFLLFFKTVGEEPSEWEPLDLLEEFGNFSKPVANVA
jgi:hypothetical protein